MSQPAPAKKISYYAKDSSKCPVCDYVHNKEELLSGGGRLIAGNVTIELRRLYKENPKFGLIVPLAYTVQVCPRCLYAAYSRDFTSIKKDELERLEAAGEYREKLLTVLFGSIDFSEPRDLLLGAASYVLAIDCYHLRNPDTAPTPKKALSSLRAAWLMDDLYKLASYRPYDKVRDFYYMEAARNYLSTLEIMQTGREPIEQASYILGPDLDHNWGYDGIIYLNSYLTKKFIHDLAGSDKDRLVLLEKSKRYLSKLYGSGKSSKSKPNMIVDMAKELYDEIGNDIDLLKGPQV